MNLLNRKVIKMTSYNPRGIKRPRDGRGRGVGMPGGRRQGQNPNPCGRGGRGVGRGGNR